jgi:hypothetical protein
MTVAERLALDPTCVNSSLYTAGTEPAATLVSDQARRGKRASRVALDEYLDDARAGASDARIARRAGATTSQVRRWRLQHGLVRPSGRPTVARRLNELALDVFAEEYIPVLHEVRSPVSGAWSVPEYVVRRALDYAAFARAARVLVDAGFDARTAAAAIGVRERDIVDAIALAEARLR